MTYTYDVGPDDPSSGPAIEHIDSRLRQRRAGGHDHPARRHDRVFSSYQEQGWTNSGTSGSPAAATLLAEAATTYTDPNGNTSRPGPTGWAWASSARPPTPRERRHQRPQRQRPARRLDRPLNRITQYTYDSQGNITKITYPDLTNDQYTYNSDSEPLTHTDANKHTTSYTYDSHGNLTGHPGPAQQPDHHDLHVDRTGPDDQGREQQYDELTNTTARTGYDDPVPGRDDQPLRVQLAGKRDQVTDGRGTRRLTYDALNRETGTTDALGDITTITYDAAGNLTKVQAPTPAGQTAGPRRMLMIRWTGSRP